MRGAELEVARRRGPDFDLGRRWRDVRRRLLPNSTLPPIELFSSAVVASTVAGTCERSAVYSNSFETKEDKSSFYFMAIIAIIILEWPLLPLNA
ncbi:Hypothetical predicted protein [Cloeon dipterum]|uniref:Uncharacterized protein n=1 Tax=Cloeon dipterum TaxID=197152 RepID=A0A8S1DM03_9INSE|nr:Hypothetical predicted protein [Cloeon dipterum]